MTNKLYVGGLSYSTSDQDLETAFLPFGNVVSAVVIMDRDTGQSKGFGFVEMGTPGEASEAVSKLNGTPLQGRNIAVNEARERTERRPSSNRY